MRSILMWWLALVTISATLSCAKRHTEEPSARVPDVVFVPTPFAVVDAMLDVARVKAGDVVYDLGSGDGRIVIAAARRFGTRGVGIDIDPLRIVESNRNADTAGVRELVEFRQADLFTTDLKPASVVTLYLLPELNVRLRPKLFAELKPGSRVVSHSFDMGDWKADSTLVVEMRVIHFWVIPAHVHGEWIAALPGSAHPASIRLAQEYQEITSAEVVQPAGVTLRDARVRGDSIWLTLEPGGTRLAGRVVGDSIQGSGWVARRKPPGT